MSLGDEPLLKRHLHISILPFQSFLSTRKLRNDGLLITICLFLSFALFPQRTCPICILCSALAFQCWLINWRMLYMLAAFCRLFHNICLSNEGQKCYARKQKKKKKHRSTDTWRPAFSVEVLESMNKVVDAIRNAAQYEQRKNNKQLKKIECINRIRNQSSM